MKILLAIDGSRFSEDAVQEVAERPWPPGQHRSNSLGVSAYTPPATEIVLENATFERLRQPLADDAEQRTARVKRTLEAAGLSAETAVLEGDPRATIVNEAERWRADLIVMGSHGRTGLKLWLIGSVAGAVVSHAPCSIEVVRRRAA
jgi:nucleotide-binding universal stress UspA family protein